MMETNVDSYPETRVFLAPSGELMLALPIYANQAGAFFDEDEVDKIAGVKLSMGIYDRIGYVAYHPQVGEIVLSKECTDHGIVDLGLLSEKEKKEPKQPDYMYTIEKSHD